MNAVTYLEGRSNGVKFGIGLMSVILRHAKKAEKLEPPLDTDRDRIEIGTRLSGVYVLAKGTGTWTLTFVFYDGTEIELSQTEVSDGTEFAWETERLLLTNPAQVGETLKLLVGIQVG